MVLPSLMAAFSHHRDPEGTEKDSYNQALREEFMSQTTTRRHFLLSSAGLTAWAGSLRAAAPAPAEKTYELKLGVASYSLREFSRKLAIQMIKELGTPYVNVKDVHLPYTSTAEELHKARKDFDKARLIVVGGGSVDMKKDDDEDIRRYFEYARTFGLPLMVIAPTAKTLPRIEKFVKEYNIPVAVHNHGTEDKHFPSPYDVLKIVRDMDPRVGLCIDVGHTARTGTDVVQAIADAGPRLLDMHMKDLRDLKDKESQCEVGKGVLPIVGILQQLKKMKYQGSVNLEYEIHSDAPLTGMKESFAYMRGVLDGLRTMGVAG